MKEKLLNIDPELYKTLKEELLSELKDKETLRREQLAADRSEKLKAHEQYVKTMKESLDPWVDIQGFTETDSGIRLQLDWNDAFVNYLKENGISGTDDENTVQKWVTLLLRDMADRLEEDRSEKTTSDYA